MAGIGEVKSSHLDYARSTLEKIPGTLRGRLRRLGGAQGVVYALLLREDQNYQSEGFEATRVRVPGDVQFETGEALKEVATLEDVPRMVLLDLALPALRQMPNSHVMDFLETVQRLIEADQQTTLMEFTISRVLTKNMDPAEKKRARKAPSWYELKPLIGQVRILLGAIAYCGDALHNDAMNTFEAGRKCLGAEGASIAMPEQSECDAASIREAFSWLESAAPKVKKQVIEACVCAVTSDDKITTGEIDILRGICEALDCPMPPITQSH